MKVMKLAFLLMVFGVITGVTAAYACDTCGCQANMQMDSEDAAELPEWHVKSPADLNVSVKVIEPMEVAYLEGTIMGDMDALFGELMAAAGEQGLVNDNTMVGSVYPDDMSKGVDEKTRVFVGISIDKDADVAEPLMKTTIEGGSYMVVEHWGDYQELEATYTKLHTWAGENKIAFRNAPSFEHYVTDPESTPVEKWLTRIYMPFDHAVKIGGDDMDQEEDDEHAGHDH